MQFFRLAHVITHTMVMGVITIVCVLTHIMIHHSLGQVFIRQGWEASLPDVRLSKFVRMGARVDPAYPKANNT